MKHWPLIPVACALSAAMAALGGCVSDRCTGMSAPTPKEEPAGPAPTSEVAPAAEPASVVAAGATADASGHIPLEFIPEMGPFPAEFSGSAQLDPQEREKFVSAWRLVAPDVEAGVTAAKLVDISRWAAQQTASARLERGWAGSMPMHPIGASADGRVLMGQAAEESKAALPSHNNVVFRRLLVAAEFERESGRIGRVFVTIRGWAEE